MSDLRTAPREFLSEFIDLYRENQCLWKIKSKDYSDRNEKKLGVLGAGRETSRNRFGVQQRKSYKKLIILEVHSEKK
jgi:hypothetical protein